MAVARPWDNEALYAVWGGGATPQQALHMVGLILPPKAAA
jgi:hypothetical protein